jgi:beta-glucosidase
VSAWDPARGVSVRVKVKNTGTRRGAEVVQVYVHDDVASVPRPEQELRAFQRVELAAGEEREVVLALPLRAFQFAAPTGAGDAGWRLEPGTFEIRVGSSSRDVRLRAALTVPGP